MKFLITIILAGMFAPTFASTDIPENELSLVTYTPVKNSIIQPGKSAFLPFDLNKLHYETQFVDCHISFDNGESNEVPTSYGMQILWHTTTSQGESLLCQELCRRKYQGVWGLKRWPATYSPVTFNGMSANMFGPSHTIKYGDDIIEIGAMFIDPSISSGPFPEPGVTISNMYKQTSITISDCKYSSYPTVLTNL